MSCADTGVNPLNNCSLNFNVCNPFWVSLGKYEKYPKIFQPILACQIQTISLHRINEAEARKYQGLLLQTHRRQQIMLHHHQQQQQFHQRMMSNHSPASPGQPNLKISSVSSLANQPPVLASRFVGNLFSINTRSLFFSLHQKRTCFSYSHCFRKILLAILVLSRRIFDRLTVGNISNKSDRFPIRFIVPNLTNNYYFYLKISFKL